MRLKTFICNVFKSLNSNHLGVFPEHGELLWGTITYSSNNKDSMELLFYGYKNSDAQKATEPFYSVLLWLTCTTHLIQKRRTPQFLHNSVVEMSFGEVRNLLRFLFLFLVKETMSLNFYNLNVILSKTTS